MRVESTKEALRLWPQLVSPILWPVLLAQLVLVGLGLAIILICLWLMPAQASWRTICWLLLALLLGSGLNVAIFLMLLKQRLRRHGQELAVRLDQLGDCLSQHVDAHGMSQEAPHSPLARLDIVVASVEGMIGEWQGELAHTRQAERRLADDLESLRGRAFRLETERERAKEASRLKSHYLAHLQQTLTPSLTMLEKSLDMQQFPELADKLRGQLAEAQALLGTLDEAPASQELPSARVLIVDDGPVNLMLARQVLERQGLQVVTATCGSEALERLGEMPIDLVFMDIFMADMDGVETCRTWREREASGSERPRNVVVALTANAGAADRRRFEQAGMDGYLAKPYRPQDLLETVRHWLPGALRDNEGWQ